jgi:glycosyltransferase involved in cell wall biosynthesis
MSVVASTSMARVLLLSLAPERGGAEVVIEQVARRLDPSTFQPVLGPQAASPLHARWKQQGFDVLDTLRLPRWRRLDQWVSSVRTLRAVLVAARIDLVYTHGVAGQLLGGRAAAQLGVPVVWHVHDIFESSLTFDGVLHRLAAATPSRRVIAISETVAASLAGRVEPKRLVTIPNGVSAEIVPPVIWQDDAPRVVWCGRLQPWKGAHVFLRAARLVLETLPHVRFVIVGGALFGLDAGYPARLRADARSLGLEGSVEFVGHVGDARPWLAAAAVVVHCSTRPEPFGLVVAEAMMQRRPVVAFARGGPAEMLREGAGVTVRPDDESALARAIAGLLEREREAASVGQLARERARSHYEVGRMAAEISEILSTTLSA